MTACSSARGNWAGLRTPGCVVRTVQHMYGRGADGAQARSGSDTCVCALAAKRASRPAPLLGDAPFQCRISSTIVVAVVLYEKNEMVKDSASRAIDHHMPQLPSRPRCLSGHLTLSDHRSDR